MRLSWFGFKLCQGFQQHWLADISKCNSRLMLPNSFLMAIHWYFNFNISKCSCLFHLKLVYSFIIPPIFPIPINSIPYIPWFKPKKIWKSCHFLFSANWSITEYVKIYLQNTHYILILLPMSMTITSSIFTVTTQFTPLFSTHVVAFHPHLTPCIPFCTSQKQNILF